MIKLSFGSQTVSKLSTEYVYAIEMCEMDEGFNPLPPLGIIGSIDWAFTLQGSDPLNWVIGDQATIWSDRFARCLIGPNGVQTFNEGRYDVWVRITQPPEISIQRVGVLTVF